MANLATPLAFPLGGSLEVDTVLSFNDSVIANDALRISPQVPLIIPVSPLAGAVGVPPDAHIIFDVRVGAGAPVTLSSVLVAVEGVTAWESGGPTNGWTGALVTTLPTHRFTLIPPTGFSYDEVVLVSISLDYVVVEEPVVPGDIVTAADTVRISVGRGLTVADSVTVTDTTARV